MKNQNENMQNTKGKKGFHITIRNLDTNEITVETDTRAIIGAFQNGGGINSICYTACNLNILINTLYIADKCVRDMTNNMIEESGKELLEELFKELQKIHGGQHE